MATINRKELRRKVHRRIRRKLSGSQERPRLAVSFSNQHVYAQIINDEKARTVVAASTLDKEVSSKGANVETAAKVGELVAKRASAEGITEVVFDRGGFYYHGKVKALADAARENGLKF